MAINTEGNIFDQEPDDNLRDRLVSDEQKIRALSPASASATTVRRPSASATAPLFTQQEKIGYTLIPLASALLQGKRSGGGSLLNDTLGSLGQGLMGSADMALRIKQLEGKKRETGGAVRNVKLQPKAGAVEIQGQVYTPDMGREFTLDEATMLMYPPDTFMDVQDTEKRKMTTIKGSFARYLSKEDALKQFPQEKFGDFYTRFIPSNPSMIGEPILGANNRPLRIQGNYIGSTPVMFDLIPESVSPIPRDQSKQSLRYMTKPEALKFLKGFGADENTPGFNAMIKLITEAEGRVIEEGDRLLGRPVVFGDKLQDMTITKRGDKIESLTNLAGDVPQYIKDYQDFRKGVYNKFLTTDNSRKNVAKQLAIFGGQILRGELKTGAIQKFTLPMRNLLASLPGSNMTAQDIGNLNNQQLFSAFLGQVAGTFRVPGSGSTSDREFAAFQGAIGNLANQPEGQYLNMYFVRKNFERERKANEIRATMMKGGYSEAEINEEINKELSKPIGVLVPAKYKDDPDGFKEWYKSQPDGTVITNVDADGIPIIKDVPTIHVVGMRVFEED